MAQSVRQSNLFRAEDWRIIYRAFPQVNFNAYDFDTIRRSLISYLRFNYPEDFNDWVESSEFVSIIDLIAVMGESLAFRMDINSRENFIDTAERRESVLRLSRMLSYVPSRNLAAQGFVKVVSVTTNDDVFDSNDVNLNGQEVLWNDRENPDWFEQFTTIMNSALVSSNPFGIPLRETSVTNTLYQIYRFDNIPANLGQFTFNATVDNASYPFEIVNFSYDEEDQIFRELDPSPVTPSHVVYRNDGNGFGSTRTGFFFYVKQGTLTKQDFNIANPLENRVLNFTRPNINNSDVWVQTVNDNGTTRVNWTQVPALVGNNVIFNAIDRAQRSIFQVVTEQDDRISIRFADGRFGDIPTGIIRVLARQSANQALFIRPQDMRNRSVSIQYINQAGLTRNLTVKFSLQETISNAAQGETLESMRVNAPRVYYTQDRIVNGEDANVTLLSNPITLKSKSVNRTYSAHSRFIDINDPTSNYSNANVYANDGMLYRNFDDNRQEVRVGLLSDAEVIAKYFQPFLKEKEFNDFFFTEWKKQWLIANPELDASTQGFFWQQSKNSIYSSSGKFVDSNGTVRQVNTAIYTGFKDLIRVGSILRFKKGGWVSVTRLYRDGTITLPTGQDPIVLNENIEDGDELIDLIPVLTTTIDAQLNEIILEKMEINRSFFLTYDWQNSRFTVTDVPRDGIDDGPFVFEDPKNGWLFKFIKNNIAGRNSWEITGRGVQYVFESVKDVRFFFDTSNQTFDFETRKTVQDNIQVLPINQKPESQEGIGNDGRLSLVGSFVYEDGFKEPRRVKVSFFDADLDGSPDNPDFFERIVLDREDGTVIDERQQYLFWELQKDTLGYETLVPINIEKVYKTVEEMDQAFFDTPQDFNDEETIHVLDTNAYYLFNLENVVIPTAENPNPNREGEPKIPSEQDQLDSALFDRQIGRKDLAFRWQHFADDQTRIDPSRSNIIDMFVLTTGYDREVRNWIRTNRPIEEKPVEPSPQDLRLAFQDLEDIKMISDQFVFRPVKYKLLFGTRADEELQAKFRVIKIPSSQLSDGEIRATVVNTINEFFNVNNWDFGDTFYATELISYIQARTATSIASVVLVPQNEEARFGNLFEVPSEPDEIFISAATTDDVEVVGNLTETNLRINR